jgi:protein-tyrosine-phosphatase
MDGIKKILVVCTGNACRSPMAEGFLKKHLKGENGFEIISAGTAAICGFNPTPEAVEVMREEGIDISRYISTPFSLPLAEAVDIILVMSQRHKDFILHNTPALKDKVFLYRDFAGITDQNKDIVDPIGQPLSTYKTVRDQIKQATEAIVRKLVSR